MRNWWHCLTVRTKVGASLAVLGVGLTALLAFLGNIDDPPSASVQALLAFFAIVAQLGGAWTFSGEGKADPTLAQRSVSRLVALARRAEDARQQAEALSARSTPVSDIRDGIGHISVHLSYLEEGLVEAVEDWRAFHPRAVKSAEDGHERNGVDDE